MAKITEYAEATRFDQGDILIKDGVNGTKKISVNNAAIEFVNMVSPINHRNVYRGKNLGTSVTNDQKTAISSGTFDDLFVGDYWEIDGVNWIIADFDYWYGMGGSSSEFTSHHLVIVPETSLYSAKMNDTATTEGGYHGSKMYTENLDQAKTAFSNAFGDMVLTHKEMLTTSVVDGHAGTMEWFDSTVELMNEIMLLGCFIRSTEYETNSKQQLSLFRLNPKKIKSAGDALLYWLRDIAGNSSFVCCVNTGIVAANGALLGAGVRPVAAIG